MARVLALLFLWAFCAGDCLAAERVLTLSFGGEPHRMTAAELLARPDVTDLNVPNDVSYNRKMTYRAVPLLGVLGAALDGDFNTIEARASDGYVSQIPSELVKKGSEGGAVAWIAVEDPGKPWPNLPDRDVSAGPFYLIWEGAQRSAVGNELWPFSVVSLSGVDDPVKRWPQLAVDRSLADDAAERKGQIVFVKNCMTCHRIDGAGYGEMGPDLGRPMHATEYITERGLKALIRNPKAVRTWPQQQMEGFGEEAISNSELDALVSYLAYMGRRKSGGVAFPSKPTP
ncbi:c-type cytochrome [Hyphomicrobium sp. 99]|uniref:c-type cytochrome n=1 Tax=Hyphomicrobium sp. 99 TaxID=1163419 RepID=UPI0005F79583|nr:c-type cytochrome [Hyphomicrobium sp. 99]